VHFLGKCEKRTAAQCQIPIFPAVEKRFFSEVAIIVFELDWFVKSLLKEEGVLNSHENLQFWQIAQPLLSLEKSQVFFPT